MNTLQLPKMSTDKPVFHGRRTDNGMCTNYLNQEFRQKAPNLVWVSDLTYLKAAGKWYYLCIIMDLFSRKVIAWHISKKPDVELIMTCFRKAYEKRNAPYGCTTQTGEANTLPLHFGSFWILLMLCSHFPKRDILLTMRAANVFSNISKKKKQTAEPIAHCRSFSSLFLNISKVSIIPKDHIVLLVCSLQMRQKIYTGSGPNQLFPDKFLLKMCHLLDYGSIANLY